MSLLEVLQRTPGEILSKKIRNIIKENKIQILICINITDYGESDKDLSEILKIKPKDSIFNIVRININNYYFFSGKDIIYLSEIIENNTELEYFGITNCLIDTYQASILMLPLVKCQKLIEINLDQNFITAKNPYFKKFIENFSKCINVKKINLNGNNVSDSEIYLETYLTDIFYRCEISVKNHRIFHDYSSLHKSDYILPIDKMIIEIMNQ